MDRDIGNPDDPLGSFEIPLACFGDQKVHDMWLELKPPDADSDTKRDGDKSDGATPATGAASSTPSKSAAPATASGKALATKQSTARAATRAPDDCGRIHIRASVTYHPVRR